MDKTHFIEMISEKINKDQSILPCLFFGTNSELLNQEVNNIAQQLAEEFQVHKTNIYTLEDNSEKIKISEIKEFTQMAYTQPPCKFQIFIIENISRLTIQSSNSCLKLLEEPGVFNIFFLTNHSESWVLDTILSRTQTISLWGSQTTERNNFYFDLITNFLNGNKTEIFSYFFNLKAEKEEYILFLKNLILYAREYHIFIDLLDEIEADIQGILQNNVNARYIIDKYLILINQK